MARLQRGEDPKIDKINDLVAVAINGNSVESNDALTELLKMFKPMMIKVCTKWSNYFNDSAHSIISFGELLADAEYWFVHYTMHKYTINGDATYNKFIKDHIDQRIRYIYECQLRYYKRLVFPDPNRHADGNEDDPFELVVHNYSSNVASTESIEDTFAETDMMNKRADVAKRIMELVQSGNFNNRERRVFQEVMLEGCTQEEMGRRLGVSRIRVVQILRKVKYKLKVAMETDDKFWQLITQTDIKFDNNYL